MKQLIAFAVVFCTLHAGAQIKQGKVVYERVMQMRVPVEAELAGRVPGVRTDHFELQFGNSQSLWQMIPNQEGDDGTVSGPGFVFRMRGMDDVVYHNFTQAKRVDQRDLFERDYLVEDSITKLAWKLTSESKTILGYKAIKAITQRIQPRPMMIMENGVMKRQMTTDTALIVAWFTTDIIVPAGPQEYQGQLPGLILELNVNNGRAVYKAVEFSEKVNLSAIREPKGGKRVTSAEFDKEREKLMEEMRKNNPGGNRTIRIGG